MSSAEQTWHNAFDIRASPDEGGLMRGEKKEEWMALCEQAANEQEIDRLLAEKQQRLGKQEPSPKTDA